MSFPARFFKGAAATGTFDTIAAGNSVGGTVYPTNEIALNTLSCLYTVLAETNTITLACHWQVSHDNSTWYDIKPSNGASYVTIATGTGGADTFRIKIWWEDDAGEHVVYDNGMDQAIGGGSIVVHTKKK